jgi:hypothetical protein
MRAGSPRRGVRRCHPPTPQEVRDTRRFIVGCDAQSGRGAHRFGDAPLRLALRVGPPHPHLRTASGTAELGVRRRQPHLPRLEWQTHPAGPTRDVGGAGAVRVATIHVSQIVRIRWFVQRRHGSRRERRPMPATSAALEVRCDRCAHLPRLRRGPRVRHRAELRTAGRLGRPGTAEPSPGLLALFFPTAGM